MVTVKTIRARIGLAAMTAMSVTASTPAYAELEKDLVARYCAGMIQEFTNPDWTRTDCISSTHAIEVDFSNNWADAIGQALHYSLWTKEYAENQDTFPRWYRQVNTPRRAGIILICRSDGHVDTCENHVVRPFRIAEEFHIPLTIWQCDAVTDLALSDCLRIDSPYP